MFIEALFPIAKVQKQPASTLIDERIKKIWCDTYISIHHTYTHTHTHTHTHIMEYNLPIKRKKLCYLQQHGWT